DELGLQVADKARAHLRIDSESSAAAQIDRGDGQSLIHGHKEIAGAQNAALLAERAIEGLAQRDADVFDSVMLIDIEIAIAFEFQIKGAMTSEELQHVIEKAN